MSKLSTEEKIRIVLDGMRCPEGITGLCRQVGISRSTYYHWQRTLLEKGNIIKCDLIALSDIGRQLLRLC